MIEALILSFILFLSLRDSQSAHDFSGNWFAESSTQRPHTAMGTLRDEHMFLALTWTFLALTCLLCFEQPVVGLQASSIRLGFFSVPIAQGKDPWIRRWDRVSFSWTPVIIEEAHHQEPNGFIERGRSDLTELPRVLPANHACQRMI